MTFLMPDISDEQEQKLTANGWVYLTNSWGRSIWVHEDHGQRWAEEAFELIEAKDG